MTPSVVGLALAAVGLLAAGCSGTAAVPTVQANGSTQQPVSALTAGVSGGSPGAVGYDCPTLISPAELDSASGLKGGTVTTTRSGDQPSEGDVMGVTECAIANDTVGTWFGHISIFTGSEALGNFAALWDNAKQAGATSISGIGTEALVKSDESGTDMYARGANGVGIGLGLAWDSTDTNEQAVEGAERQILTLVLSRT